MTRGRVAIIPARGCSKRLPRKNILDFFGKPMIAWTIEAAHRSGLFDRILVSTEDDEIAQIARGCGIEVPFSREHYYDDHSTVSDVALETLRQAAEILDEEYEQVVQLMPNCPLRDADDIRSAIGKFESRGVGFQISCSRFGSTNPMWAMRLDDHGRGEPIFLRAIEERSQDLPVLYCPSGAIWVARADSLRMAGTFYGPDHRFEPLSWLAAVDIDDANDLEFARAAFLVKRASDGADYEL